MPTADELSRYARQLALPEVGLAGQERLRTARVLIVGAGGLGSPAALYLAAAGIGVIGILDDDIVEASNLHRQILHATSDIGRAKAESAADTLRRLNPHPDLRVHRLRLTADNAIEIFGDYDLILDGSDNYATRYAVNDACARLGKAWIYGSVERFSGQVSLFSAPGGPCYRCIFPDPPAPGSTASCEEIGVLGAIPGVIGSLQAVEALKWILQSGDCLVGRLLQLDLRVMTARIVRFERRPDCLACSGRREPAAESARLPDSSGNDTRDIEPVELARRLGVEPVALLDIREPWEWAIAQIGDPRLLPMDQLPAELATLERSRELIVYCHHGARSQLAADWLRSQGFRARNLIGGIDRWSRDVDPGVPRY